MTNRYCDLTPSVKIKDDFSKISAGFAGVQAEMDAKLNQGVKTTDSPTFAGLLSTGPITLNNDFRLLGKRVNGTAELLAAVGSDNVIYLASGNLPVTISSPGAIKNLIVGLGTFDLIHSGGGQTIKGRTTISIPDDSVQLRLQRTGGSPGEVWLGAVGTRFVFSNSAFTEFASFDYGTTKSLSINGVKIVVGAGSPEGVVTAIVGSLFLRSDGEASTTLYVKQSGTGNTGWVAK